MGKSGRSKSYRRRAIWEKADGRCAHCGKYTSGSNQSIDHFIPRSEGGGFDERNLMPLCKKCNKRRMSIPVDPVDFYSYAKEEAIKECLAYKADWEKERTSAAGMKFL